MTNALARQLHYNLADPKSFKCFNATLMPLPVDDIMRIAQRVIVGLGVLHPDAFVDSGHLFEITSVLYRWFGENLHFRDWEYRFSSITFWDYERVSIEIEACKKYSMVSLVLAKEEVSTDYGFEIGDNLEDRGHTAQHLLTWLHRVLESINERIDQWNIVCKFAVPIFSEPLPRQSITDGMLNAVWEKAIEEVRYNDFNEAFEGTTPEEAFRYFAKEMGYFDPYSLAEIWFTGWNSVKWGSKRDWATWVDVEIPDWEYLMLFSFYVSREGCPLVFKVLDFVLEDPGDTFAVEEAEEYVNQTIDAAEAAMINWNETTNKPSEKADLLHTRRDAFKSTYTGKTEHKEDLFYRDVTSVVKQTNPYSPYVQLKLPFKP